jgi:hypothetical protein
MAGVKFKNVVGDYADVELIKGSTISFSYIWGGDTPINIEDFDAEWLIYNNGETSESVRFSTDVSPPSGEGQITKDAPLGKFIFNMTFTDSSNLPDIQNGRHILWITNTDTGERLRGLYGRVDNPKSTN